jgi:prepilin-type processing-associated H-X9-DG protein
MNCRDDRYFMNRRASWRPTRRGVTMIEATVGVVVLVLIICLAIPLIFRLMGSMQKNGCTFNLRNLGQAIDSYQNRHNGQLPGGARYHNNPPSPWGTSWWVDVLPQAGTTLAWDQHLLGSGDFNGAVGNPNIKLVDGLAPAIMFCPASDLSLLNDPAKAVSAGNRELLGGRAQGLAVPHYVAIAGSAPDMLGLSPEQPVSGPHGRNTKDGPLGILSASGAFPPNQTINLSSLRDGQSHVILVGEQSGYGIEDFYETPLRHELRSAWPAGAYTGAGGQYGYLNAETEGINGTGEERCFNITTVRYGINTRSVDAEKPRPGIIAERVDAYPPPPKEKKPKHPVSQPPGPGHNQGIFSVHEGGANVLFADGRVEFMNDDMEVYALQMLVTRDDGNIDQKKKKH